MKRVALCLLAACGGSDDAAPDAEPPPFQMGTAVRVEITSRGQFVPDVQVMFQNADGAVISVGVTDAVGGLGADIEDGGFVTVVEPPHAPSGRQVLTTFAAVHVGDVLHLDFDPLGPLGTENITVNFTDDVSNGVVQYKLQTNCGGSGVAPNIPTTFELLGCKDHMVDALLTSHDETDTLISSIFAPATMVVADPLSVDLGALTYQTAISDSVTFSPANGDITGAGVYRAFASDRGIVFEGGTTAVVDSGTFTSSITMPDFRGDDMPTGLTMITSSTTFVGVSSTTVHDWKPDPGRTAREYELDLANVQLKRFLDNPNPDPLDPAKRPAVYSLDNNAISWFEGAGAEPDLVRARLSIFRDAVPVGRGWEWRMIAPRNGTELAFPTLSPDLSGFDFNPADGDTVGVTELTTVKLTGVELDTVRQHGFEGFNSFRAGATGQIVTQDLVIPDPEQPL